MLTPPRTPYFYLLLSLLTLWSGGSLCVHAQQDVALLQYWRAETQWNPSAVGRSPQLSINGLLQSHAMGYEDAGSTMWAGADMALHLAGTWHGLGASFLNDQIGFFSHKRFALQYAHHRKAWGGQFSLGGQLNLMQEDIDATKADFGSGNDPAFPNSKVSGAGIGFSAGLSYRRKALHLALAAHHLTAPEVEIGPSHRLQLQRNFYLMGGYDFRLSPHYQLTPSALLRSDGIDHRVDFTIRGTYQYEGRRILAGLGYAPQHSFSTFVGGTLRGIDLCYSYEAYTSGLGLGAGQHEVSLSYRMDLNLGKKGRNLHKSVRWL